MAADSVILGIIIGTLAAIVYSLRVLILMERRLARLDINIESLTQRILREELTVMNEEKIIEKKLGVKKKRAKKAPVKKTTTKKAVKKTKKKKTTRKKR